jgi:hypothetical protein
VVFTILRLSVEASNWLVLWQVYGQRTVAHYHLSVVRIKPELVVSNGDILRGFGPIHYFYGASLWITTIAILVLLFRYVAPKWWELASAREAKPNPGAIGIIASLVMFFAIPTDLLPFIPALGFGTFAAAAGLWWLRNRMTI